MHPIAKTSFFLLFGLWGLQATSQTDSASFVPPLDIPLYLSGNFAELRSNHFHTGIDIKTQGVIGKNVLAAEGGRISRIKVSPWGYGRALYIEHPNGYTTVYGHLDEFSPRIKEAVRKKQYAENSFAVDFTPEEPISVARGEVIALSGNSGSSGGPHLHFEIRRTSDSRPLNPLKFNFDIKDNIPPRIRGVRFHPLSDSTLINGKNEAQSFVVRGESGRYHLKAGTEIQVYGGFGISVHTIDYLNGYPNKCGIYSILLEVDGDPVCSQRFDELDFSTVRHINTYKAYDVYRSNRWHYHKSFIEPGNELAIYGSQTKNKGRLYFSENKMHEARYEVQDAYGNTSILSFSFKSLSEPGDELPVPEPYDAYFSFDSENEFTYGEEINIRLPKGALYKDLKFSFGRELAKAGQLTPRYTVHRDDVPLQKPMEVVIRPLSMPAKLKEKVLAARYTSTGGASYHTGRWIEEGFSFSSKYFGKFTLVADTTAPEVSLQSAKPGAITKDTAIHFRIEDNRSGVASYEALFNGEWVLAEYDPKNDRLSVIFDYFGASTETGTLEVKVVDAVGNERRQKLAF